MAEFSAKSVELHHAFVWTCEECGRDNFERAIDYTEIYQEEGAILCQEPQDDSDEVLEFVLAAPMSVECQYCHEEYETEA